MSNLLSRLNEAVFAPILRGNPGEAISEIKRWLYSDSLYWGLKRDLFNPCESSTAKIPITVRELRDDDIEYAAKVQAPEEEIRQLARRVKFMRDGVKTCYVAVSEADEPGYMQWLIGPADNDFIQKSFRGLFPWLGHDEALLEYAFTLPDYRGLGLMPKAMDLIAQKGAGIGARYIITFVSENNIPALKGCKRSCFSPYIIVRDRRRFFRRKIEFLDLSEGPPYPLD
jgi:GNAT superfamily N-acetyltransferase